ncbi:hypothetical protein K931_21206 [Aeromonas salmonicida subsp. pectinolytica 34mel]|nr:hypothetical protein K931_21206 [Aeromonas salmonicida subsp. pectinolytica 34mel]
MVQSRVATKVLVALPLGRLIKASQDMFTVSIVYRGLVTVFKWVNRTVLISIPFLCLIQQHAPFLGTGILIQKAKSPLFIFGAFLIPVVYLLQASIA